MGMMVQRVETRYSYGFSLRQGETVVAWTATYKELMALFGYVRGAALVVDETSGTVVREVVDGA
jgi:hypothetical protein